MKFKRLRAFRLARGRREGILNDDSIAGLRDTRYKISRRSLDRFWVWWVGECLGRGFVLHTQRTSSGDRRWVGGTSSGDRFFFFFNLVYVYIVCAPSVVRL